MTELNFYKDILPWILSGITIWMTLLAGNLHRSAWAVGLLGQALWAVYILGTETWGLIPLNLTLWVVYFRNHLKWNRVSKSSEDET